MGFLTELLKGNKVADSDLEGFTDRYNVGPLIALSYEEDVGTFSWNAQPGGDDSKQQVTSFEVTDGADNIAQALETIEIEGQPADSHPYTKEDLKAALKAIRDRADLSVFRSSDTSTPDDYTPDLSDSMLSKLKEFATSQGLDQPVTKEEWQTLITLYENQEAQDTGGGYSEQERLRLANAQQYLDSLESGVVDTVKTFDIADSINVDGSGFSKVTDPVKGTFNGVTDKLKRFTDNLFSLKSATAALAAGVAAAGLIWWVLFGRGGSGGE